jgi:tight adherence protein B
MILAAAQASQFDRFQVFVSIVMLVLTVAAAYVGWAPLRELIRRREREYDLIFRRALLLDVPPRMVTIVTGMVIVVLGFMGYALTRSVWGLLPLAFLGAMLPHTMIRYLRSRRLKRLEEQLVGGVQTLASGVRAGLNLTQSLALVARDGPNPLRQEFRHLTREYEYGISLEEAMRNAADRIGSADFRLLFAALQTHRERGGDLGETLDRIAESIREIQRLEGRVQTLTAQGRATARWLAVMPAVILAIMYLIDAGGVKMLFTEPVGNVLLGSMALLTFLGFLWIRKVIAIDI